ncbi:penicillin-binding transpeptidase domain-containing protein [Paenibacillus sediminis]|uniref:Cell division protein FtsI/penicillin-binding protein 2 n=1 Tax=Paenibacillus sediminis TaxID=664909 RepID=A0ABS4H6T6_9BACL|nr:penicillin-binding transpeptidase domain-containing protein [Paenibacillus sediminis]MBP1937942.1 cell division protein FtsI/penicillin-binding protein 2 [Paenibacillus sediminis]
MKNLLPNKEREAESKRNRQFAVRLNVFFFSAFTIFCLIIIRLAILQFVESPTLTEQETSISVKEVPLPPMRGTIYDASGQKIAYSTPAQSLYITLLKDYSQQSGNYEEALKIAEGLVKVFNTYGDPNGEHLTVSDVIKAMDVDYRKYSGYVPRRIKMDLTEKEIAHFMERKDDYPGIEVVEDNVRHYDPAGVAVQTVGYIRKFKGTMSLDKYKALAVNSLDDPSLQYSEMEDVGFDGLEFMYQDDLRGRNGFKTIPVNPKNMADGLAEVTPPEKGHDLWMTIHKGIQLRAEQAILDQLHYLQNTKISGEYHKNATTGFAVAMEVKTGNIMAMASMPDYDPNIWRAGSISAEDYEAIKNIYLNGTIRSFPSGQEGQHPESVVLMGSTIKPLSVLIGLNEGFFTTSSTYQDRGIAYFGKEGHETSVRNSSNHVYGTMDPARAIEKSSNVFMVDMVGKKLYTKYGSQGIDVWDKYMKSFGLGVSTEVGLPYEYLGFREYVRKESGSAQAALVYGSFGQQGKYTTLQLAQYVATIANNGKRIKPQLVSKITDNQGNIVKTFKPEVLNEVKFDKAYWEEVKRGMKSSVQGFEGFPYDYVRKTGTSQQVVGHTIVDNGVFIAYAPADNPVLAVAVVIPEGGFGAYSAAPVARKIFDAYDEVYGLSGKPKE